MKNQYFSTRTLPQPPATSPELSGTATELPGAAQKLSRSLAPARAESGQPQNWSPGISRSPKPLNISEKSMFSGQNPSKTSCKFPRAPWKRHRASMEPPICSLEDPLARARRRPRARSLAGLKTGPRRFLTAYFQSSDHQKQYFQSPDD